MDKSKRADFELMYIKRKMATICVASWSCDYPDLKFFKAISSVTHQGCEETCTVCEKLLLTSSCDAFQFYWPSVSDTIWFYYRWVFEMTENLQQRRKTVSFFVKMLPPLPQRVPRGLECGMCLKRSLLRRSRPLLLWCCHLDRGVGLGTRCYSICHPLLWHL